VYVPVSADTTGFVLSILIVTLTGPVVPPALEAVQERVSPAVSAVNISGLQPESIDVADSPSLIDHVRFTGVELFQPFALGAGVTCACTLGGVESAAAVVAHTVPDAGWTALS
jgi:hypothetical protein